MGERFPLLSFFPPPLLPSSLSTVQRQRREKYLTGRWSCSSSLSLPLFLLLARKKQIKDSKPSGIGSEIHQEMVREEETRAWVSLRKKIRQREEEKERGDKGPNQTTDLALTLFSSIARDEVVFLSSSFRAVFLVLRNSPPWTFQKRENAEQGLFLCQVEPIVRQGTGPTPLSHTPTTPQKRPSEC